MTTEAPLRNRAEDMAAAQDDGFRSWDWASDGGFFKPGERQTEISARGYAIRAIKRELVWLGEQGKLTFAPRSMVDNAYYGTNAVPNFKLFQRQNDLMPDGVIGPRTMRALCHPRIENFQAQQDIPDNLLCRVMDLESGWYPACRNTTNDYGLAQIHDPLAAKYADGKPLCPNGEWQYAFRVGVNVRYLGEHLRRNHDWLKPDTPANCTPDDLWRAAVGAHNAPYWAQAWLRAGLPAKGGDALSGWFKDYSNCDTTFEWMTLYTHVVYSREC